MTLGQRQEKFAEHLCALLAFAIGNGYGVRIGEVERTAEQQAIYIKTGRSKTMNSNHLVKCAADLHFTKDGALCYPDAIGKYWESLDEKNSAGMFWKSFKDAPHFERRA